MGTEEDTLPAACYRDCFAFARKYGLGSIAFPAISTGVYGFPPDRAAGIAVAGAQAHGTGFTRIVFVCFDETTEALYREELETLRTFGRSWSNAVLRGGHRLRAGPGRAGMVRCDGTGRNIQLS